MKRVIPFFILSCCLLFACNTGSNDASSDSARDETSIAPNSENVENSENSAELTETTAKETTERILGTFEFRDCPSHVEKDFDCSCDFSATGNPKDLNIFVSDLNESACVKVKGQLNALYADWEERDYKAELKKLAESKTWVSVSGEVITYFGKPLEDYKYESAIEFLTDVILASGKKIDVIPIQSTAGGKALEKAQSDNKAALAKAKEYMSKGVEDPLTIYKYDNRTYDVFIRVRKTTEYEGEANKYEGEITLLSHRTNDIIETRSIKGICGC